MLDRLEASDTELRAAYAKVGGDPARAALHRRREPRAAHPALPAIRGYAGLLRQFVQVTPEDRVAAVAQIELQASG